MMLFFIVVLLLVSILMPVGYAWRIFKLDAPSLDVWLLLVADAAVFVALIMIVGRWDIAGFYTRYVLILVFLLSIALSLRRHISRPWRARDAASSLRAHWTTGVSLAAFGVVLAYVLTGLVPPANPRQFAFPLAGETFVVGQGGGIGLLNHHSDHPQQRYAADIGAINAAGFRAAGLLPKELGDYAVYGASVVSPCDGTAVSTRDGLPDQIPPQADRENPAGNTVVLDCGGINVELAHLQKGSILVSEGDRLAPGDPIGKVGNSGNTTEPHLHIHAVDPVSRAGVPMAFDGRVPIRNLVYEN